ncbi:hypothetical protein EG68_01646 [Paragonimus skrjabini miyazakii]|uniref:Palmitoyltransferase n=1 Tax=Paragonimus skrjabini miyazakii TaxID=59628 RepID=A0A8S9Z5U2_9TREM|nr:hypothetical protein EG68_01646 [Paragonimus skrjabini miyazakii]
MKKVSMKHFIRFLHLGVSLSVLLPLLFFPASILHHMIFSGEDLSHGILYLIFFSTALVAYFITSCSDPGYLTDEKARFFRHRRGQLSESGDHSEDPGANCIDIPGERRLSSTDIRDKDSLKFTHPATGHNMKTTLSETKPQTGPHPSGWPVLSQFCRWFSLPYRSFVDATFHTVTVFEDPVFTLSVPVRFCKHCLLEQPLRCRHCPDCNRCVIKFDHHCPWISNCIGERNHSSFVVFLILQAFVLWWTLYLAWSSIIPQYLWSDWFRANGLFLSEILVLLFIGIPVTVLLGFHTYLALANRTTWETLAHENIAYLRDLEDRTNPFNQGCVRNCYAFCCSRFPFGWDRIYAEAVEQTSCVQPDTIDAKVCVDQKSTSEATKPVYVRLVNTAGELLIPHPKPGVTLYSAENPDNNSPSSDSRLHEPNTGDRFWDNTICVVPHVSESKSTSVA